MREHFHTPGRVADRRGCAVDDTLRAARRKQRGSWCVPSDPAARYSMAGSDWVEVVVNEERNREPLGTSDGLLIVALATHEEASRTV